MLADDLTEDEITNMKAQPNFEKEAVKAFLQLIAKQGFKDIIESRLNNTHPRKQSYKLLISSLPVKDLSFFASPENLVNVGLWKSGP